MALIRRRNRWCFRYRPPEMRPPERVVGSRRGRRLPGAPTCPLVKSPSGAASSTPAPDGHPRPAVPPRGVATHRHGRTVGREA